MFKLKEIDERFGLLRPGSTVIDLGAAPGGWSQFARERVGKKGRIIALDLLPMEPLDGVEFIGGDFREDEVLEQLRDALNAAMPDLLMSDMAPNLSGMRAVDGPRAMLLVELALDFAVNFVRPGGGFIVKVFTTAGFDEFVRSTRRFFDRVVVFKPKSSRGRSAETYLVATGRNAAHP